MNPHKEAARKLSYNFDMFARNGRWGTCGHCPRDGAGKVLPELCNDTLRPDHQLDLGKLASMYYDEVRRIKERENCTCGSMHCSYCMSR